MAVQGEVTLAWGVYLTVTIDKAEDLPEIARTLAPVEKVYSDGHLTIRKRLDGGGYIDFACYKERVCKAVKTVTTWVPERPAQEGYYREEIEWECPKESILRESRPAEATDDTETV
jgi:hypothetical protein